MRMLDVPDENLRPRNVGLLLFTDHPAQHFDTAWTEVVHMPEGPAGPELREKRYTGPLDVQPRGFVSVGLRFCRIGARELDALVLYEEDHIMAFLDRSPIRPAHTQIITSSHVPTFEELADLLTARVLAPGQALARKMKHLYASAPYLV